MLNRLDVRLVGCPECGAAPGDVCHGVRGPRVANHASRVDEATTRAHNLGTHRVLTAPSLNGRRTLENVPRVLEALRGFGTRLRTYAREGHR